MADRRKIQRISTVLTDVLERGARERADAFRIWGAWDGTVGETIAARARPRTLKQGLLVVTVATPAWMQELQLMKEELRRKLNGAVGAEAIRDIYFVSGKVEAATTEERRPTRSRRATQPRPMPEIPLSDESPVGRVLRRILRAHARIERPRE